jgi:hypothetical protein
MSSPKRAASGAVRRAANAARRGAAEATGKAAIKGGETASADAKRLVATIERGIADGRLDVISTDALQALIGVVCRNYSARRQSGEDFAPVAKNSISATDVMIVASSLLRAADLSTFELGMWQGFTGR